MTVSRYCGKDTRVPDLSRREARASAVKLAAVRFEDSPYWYEYRRPRQLGDSRGVWRPDMDAATADRRPFSSPPAAPAVADDHDADAIPWGDLEGDDARTRDLVWEAVFESTGVDLEEEFPDEGYRAVFARCRPLAASDRRVRSEAVEAFRDVAAALGFHHLATLVA